MTSSLKSRDGILALKQRFSETKMPHWPCSIHGFLRGFLQFLIVEFSCVLWCSHWGTLSSCVSGASGGRRKTRMNDAPKWPGVVRRTWNLPSSQGRIWAWARSNWRVRHDLSFWRLTVLNTKWEKVKGQSDFKVYKDCEVKNGKALICKRVLRLDSCRCEWEVISMCDQTSKMTRWSKPAEGWKLMTNWRNFKWSSMSSRMHSKTQMLHK